MEPSEAIELARLLEELDTRKNALTKLLDQKDFMLVYEAVRLEVIYMNKVGNQEYETALLASKLKRIRKKIAIIRELKENKEAVDLQKIDAQIEWFFAQDAADEHTESESVLFTEDKFKYFKEIYYRFAKKLHPDLNPSVNEDALNLWHRVRNAYENKDAEEMELLYELYENTPEIKKELVTIEIISQRIDKMKDLTHYAFKRIADIEKSFPFTVEELIRDEDWIAEKIEVSKELRRQLEEQYTAAQNELSVLLKMVI